MIKESNTHIIAPAICCIGYNRPKSIKRLLRSVGNAVYDDKDITLIISIDESPKSDEVEQAAKDFEWLYGEKIIKRYPQRMGLKEHCIRCGDLSVEYGALLFLEDDVVVSPGFYRYAKEAVNFYKNDPNVFAVSLYSIRYNQGIAYDFIPAHNGYDTYFLRGELSHGHCWIGERWKRFREWLKDNEAAVLRYNKDMPLSVYSWSPKTSWSRYVMFYLLETNTYYVSPYHSYATNMSEVGVHASKTTDICQIPLTESVQNNFRFCTSNDGVVYDAFLERIDKFIPSVLGVGIEQICLDLNGLRHDWSGYDYLLTVKELPYQVIGSFGINMDPVENNVLFQCEGDAIRLYKIPGEYIAEQRIKKKIPTNVNEGRVAHLFNKYPFRLLLRSFVLRIKSRIT